MRLATMQSAALASFRVSDPLCRLRGGTSRENLRARLNWWNVGRQEFGCSSDVAKSGQPRAHPRVET